MPITLHTLAGTMALIETAMLRSGLIVMSVEVANAPVLSNANATVDA